MNITVNIPDELLQEALEATNAKSSNQLVILALEELLRSRRHLKLKKYKGKIDLENAPTRRS